MANNKITKEALANSLKDLLYTRSLVKISVKDITERCEMSRNSFYYHFTDKYELVNWIFHLDMSENNITFSNPLKLAEYFADMCRCLYHNRDFYLACFQYTGQNSLFETLYGLYYRLWKTNLDIRCMSSGIRLTERELNLMARLDAHALVGIIADWVKEGMHNNYMNYFQLISSLLDTNDFQNVNAHYEMVS